MAEHSVCKPEDLSSGSRPQHKAGCGAVAVLQALCSPSAVNGGSPWPEVSLGLAVSHLVLGSKTDPVPEEMDRE